MSRWIHHDPNQRARAAQQADAHKLGLQRPGSRSERIADLRGWLTDRAYLLARLTGTVSVSDAGGGYAQVSPFESAALPDDRRAVALALYAPCAVLVRSDAPDTVRVPGYVLPDFETSVVSPSGDTGALPVVAVVAIAAGACVAVGILGYYASQVVDRELERTEATRRMLALDSEAREVVIGHLDREEQQGRSLPFDDSEKALLDRLTQQAEIASRPLPPMPGIVPPAASAGVGFGLGGGLVILAAAAAAWLLVFKNR